MTIQPIPKFLLILLILIYAPDYDGDEINDFLSCTAESAAHYIEDGVERWCSCSSNAAWSDYSSQLNKLQIGLNRMELKFK